MRDLSNTAGARFVKPPYPTDSKDSSAAWGVWLMPNEEVRWHTTTTPDGHTVVAGYEIIAKPDMNL